MQGNELVSLKGEILKIHGGDERQLKVIFSNDKRIIVEAPAGFGKTKTMVSRIAYLYTSGQIPNPKKILALTFSVNSALKMKRDIAELLPSLLGENNNPILLKEKMSVTNYHGFCKIVLSKYGCLISKYLSERINSFKAIGDNYNDIKSFDLSKSDKNFICEIRNDINSGKVPSIDDIRKYNDIIAQKLLPSGYVTHNAIILFTIELLQQYETIRCFYNAYYPLIVIDEFQDTNCIAWYLLENLISSDTKLLFLGDPLQRIYGFIGALPSLMEKAKTQYSMKTVVLNKNYRFKDNIHMLNLDANIRLSVKSKFKTLATKLAEIPAFWGANELNQVVSEIISILSRDTDSKIALLFRMRDKNYIPKIMQTLTAMSINYFYGMFNNEDLEYVDFNECCRNLLRDGWGKSGRIDSCSIKKFVTKVKNEHAIDDKVLTISLHCLLEALVKKIDTDYCELQATEKYDLLLDIFENRQLKQAMEYVDSPVVLSTIHSAKGLEWDYVFIMDLERSKLPSTFVCSQCPNEGICRTPTDFFPDVKNSSFKHKFIEELSLFYVAITRARKQVYFSSSQKICSDTSKKYSCFATIPGIKLQKCSQWTHF